MNRPFEMFLEKLRAADKAVLEEMSTAAKIIVWLRQTAERGEPPTVYVINQANAMRIVQFGEAIKNLIREGIVDRNEEIAPGIKASDIKTMRDIFAHPERHTAQQEYDFNSLYLNKTELLDRLIDLEKEHYNSVDISSAKEALRYLSGGGRIYSSVWKDAESYMWLYLGGCAEKLSKQCFNILDSRKGNLLSGLIRTRCALSHYYYAKRRKGNNGNVDNIISLIISLKKERLTTREYNKEFFGNQDASEVKEVMLKWMSPDKKSPLLKFYGITGCRFVAEEISFLAKSGAEIRQILLLDAVLEAKKSGLELSNLILKEFMQRPDEMIIGSLRRLDAKTRGKGGKGVFAETLEKIEKLYKQNEGKDRPSRRLDSRGQIRSSSRPVCGPAP